jgi:cysteine desulfurase
MDAASLPIPVYLDYNATTPCDPAVLEAMWPYFHDRFGNAASHTHAYGWTAREAVAVAREQVASLIGAEPGEVIFTSGATEAVNLSLKGVFERYRSKGNHIISCVTEHPAVLDSCHHLEKQGARVTWLPVDREGGIDLFRLAGAITPETVLVAIMLANNETGYVHPLKEISQIVHERGSLLFCDATQAVGKIPVGVNALGIDLMAFSGHKIYGPKGVGALYLRRKGPRVRVDAQMDGGGHEQGFRSGTLNVPGIVGFGEACRLCQASMSESAARLSALRDRIEAGMLALGGVQVNGSREHRLPHVTNLSFEGVPGSALITAATKTLALSSGSACTSALPEPSHVLLAMGVPESLAMASLRISLGRYTTAEEAEFAVTRLREVVGELRSEG